MADQKNPLKETGIDAAAKRFGALLDGIEEQEAGTPNRSEAGQGDVQNDPEPEAAEPEGDPEVTDEPEAAEPNDETPSDTKTKKVKDVSTDTEIEVEEEEAENGYLRLQDYTRKSQANAQLRKEAEAIKAEAQAKAEAYAKALDSIATTMDAMVPKEPDWITLRATKTPAEYAQIHAQWTEFKLNRDRIEAEREHVAEERLKTLQSEEQKEVEAEQEKLFAAKPEWQDPAKFNRAKKELVEFLRSQGYSDQQIGSVKDHRLVIALHNSMAYEKGRLGAPAPKIGAPRRSGLRTAGPGDPAPVRTKASADKVRTATAERLKTTGKLDDAARHFETLL